MNLLLFPLLALQTLFLPVPPNVYPSIPSAMDAARAGKKEIVIFFRTRACTECPAAWNAFEMDSKAASQYVATRLDMEDFDGKIIFEKYELENVPSWVILSPDGQLKEKWSGGWKDAKGNPVLFADPVPVKTNTQNTKATPEKSTVKQVAQDPVSTAITKKDPPLTPDTQESEKSVKPTSSLKSNTTVNGFVLQAGYFGSSANATKLIADLKAKNLSDFTIRTHEQNGTIYHRVISKVYATESEANSALQSLTASGFKATVKKSQEIQ